MSGRARDDRGQAGGFEVLPFGLLVLVVGALLVANAWGVIDAKLAVTAAAREAARVFVEAPTESQGVAAADRAAREAIAGHGRDPNHLRIERSGAFTRCGRVTFVVSYPVPAVQLPWIGSFGGSVITAKAVHSELVDPLRSGLPGSAACAP